MLPLILGGAAVLGVVALVIDDASSSNQRARREYSDTRDRSISKIKKSYYSAEQKDTLDKLYKVKKVKVKIADTIYKELKSHRANYRSINQDIRDSKKALEYLFAQKRASNDRDTKRQIQQDINAVQLSRKELFKIKDTLKERLNKEEERLSMANSETQDIVQEIRRVKSA